MARNSKQIAPKVDDADPGAVQGVYTDTLSGRAGAQGQMVSREGGQGKTSIVDSQGGARGQIMQERLGPRFRTEVGVPLMPNAPESQMVQANGLIVRSAVNRTRTNFLKAQQDLS